MIKSEVPFVSLKIGNTVAWVAMNAARNRGFVSSSHNSWTTNFENTLTIPYAEMLWQDVRPGMHDTCWAFDDSIITVARYRRDVNVSVYTEAIGAEEISSQRFKQFKELMPETERQAGLLDVSFWYYSQQHGPQSYVRQLEAPSWKSIAGNYPINTRAKIEELLLKKPGDGSGKLILWTGEPGTGKTFAVRALGEEWQSWCRLDYVIDPDNFFMQSDYLLRVILGDGGVVPQSNGQPQVPMWRLVILEDAGELLAKDARNKVGQGLSRLLNLCEGLLGQGLRVVVLITTNEEVKSLHDAVVRPGRCLANTSFERFSSAAANAWLAKRESDQHVAGKHISLAEMYAMTKGDGVTEKPVAGFLN